MLSKITIGDIMAVSAATELIVWRYTTVLNGVQIVEKNVTKDN